MKPYTFYKNIVHFTHFIHHVIIFYFNLFFHIRDMLVFPLCRVLEAREKLDTGDETALFLVWGNNNFTSIWKRKEYAENRLFL